MPNSQIANCFKLGFKNPGDALRAVRKNGEVIGGAWMIGAKWAVSASTVRGKLSIDLLLGPSTCRVYSWVVADPWWDF